MKKYAVIIFATIFALCLATAMAFSQTPGPKPDLEKFELLGISNGVAFLSADVVRSGSDITFELLMAESEVDDEGTHLNSAQWGLMTIKANCSDRTYQVRADRGVRDGVPYVGKKGSKQKPDPRSNIAQVLELLCYEQKRLPMTNMQGS